MSILLEALQEAKKSRTDGQGDAGTTSSPSAETDAGDLEKLPFEPSPGPQAHDDSARKHKTDANLEAVAPDDALRASWERRSTPRPKTTPPVREPDSDENLLKALDAQPKPRHQPPAHADHTPRPVSDTLPAESRDAHGNATDSAPTTDRDTTLMDAFGMTPTPRLSKGGEPAASPPQTEDGGLLGAFGNDPPAAPPLDREDDGLLGAFGHQHSPTEQPRENNSGLLGAFGNQTTPAAADEVEAGLLGAFGNDPAPMPSTPDKEDAASAGATPGLDDTQPTVMTVPQQQQTAAGMGLDDTAPTQLAPHVTPAGDSFGLDDTAPTQLGPNAMPPSGASFSPTAATPVGACPQTGDFGFDDTAPTQLAPHATGLKASGTGPDQNAASAHATQSDDWNPQASSMDRTVHFSPDMLIAPETPDGLAKPEHQKIDDFTAEAAADEERSKLQGGRRELDTAEAVSGESLAKLLKSTPQTAPKQRLKWIGGALVATILLVGAGLWAINNQLMPGLIPTQAPAPHMAQSSGTLFPTLPPQQAVEAIPTPQTQSGPTPAALTGTAPATRLAGQATPQPQVQATQAARPPQTTAPVSSRQAQPPMELLDPLPPLEPEPPVQPSTDQVASSSPPSYRHQEMDLFPGSDLTAPAKPIIQKVSTDQMSARIAQANRAFHRAELTQAEAGYRALLKEVPDQREAHLGLAAIAVRNRDAQAATEHYLAILDQDPNDIEALSGLINQRAKSNPTSYESDLKTLLKEKPDSAHLHFTLGSVYAAQARWELAQKSFFQAHVKQPQDPNFLLNLAVSLDQLGHAKAALPFYQKALEQVGSQQVMFDPQAVRIRLDEILTDGIAP